MDASELQEEVKGPGIDSFQNNSSPECQERNINGSFERNQQSHPKLSNNLRGSKALKSSNADTAVFQQVASS